jgi:hypothetical protein
MNPERMEHLLRQYFDSDITDTEMSELDAALRTRPEVRAKFWQEAHLQGSLREWGLEERGTRELRVLAPPAEVPPRARRENSRSLHPLAAAAAGVVFGMFCASVAWAVHSPRSSVPPPRAIPIADGSFEGKLRALPSGFPAEYGIWSGDDSSTVEDPSGKSPDGKRLLRFVHANREPTLPDSGAYSCDVFQLVDLRPFKWEAQSGEATLELAAQFLDRRVTPGDLIQFVCRVHVFQGELDSVRAEWPLTQKSALAVGSIGDKSLGGNPDQIHRVATKILLPPKADFAVVHLIAHKPKTLAGTEATFDAQYADAVQLTLQSRPASRAPILRR